MPTFYEVKLKVCFNPFLRTAFFFLHPYESRVPLKLQHWNMIFLSPHDTGSWIFVLTIYTAGIPRRLWLHTCTPIGGIQLLVNLATVLKFFIG